MMRNAAISLAALILVALGFVAAFALWQQQDAARARAMGFAPTQFNRDTAHAQDRGCDACHGNHLAADVSNLIVPRDKPERHGIFTTSYDIPMRVEDCLPCHAGSFGASLHARHLHDPAFVNMGGNCDSCHALIGGKFVLYDDETKYEVLNGVTRIPTPDFAPSTVAGSANATPTAPPR